jgi:predicted 2-oxoglutarate/Fe(II)-dependent dioxygenase YbiX
MFLPIQQKPNEVKKVLGKFIDIHTGFVAQDLCREVREYLDNNPSTHRRGSKNPELCSASFFTCLMAEPSKHIYGTVDPLLVEYNLRHKFNLLYMEPFELKKYIVGDEFTNHTDSYLGTEYGLDRKLNLIVQLSEPNSYVGGDLIIGHSNPITIPREVGTAVIFPANYPHSVSKVTEGSRYSLICHVWGPEFK